MIDNTLQAITINWFTPNDKVAILFGPDQNRIGISWLQVRNTSIVLPAQTSKKVGIEPTLMTLEDIILPLNYFSFKFKTRTELNRHQKICTLSHYLCATCPRAEQLFTKQDWKRHHQTKKSNPFSQCKTQ